MKVNGIISAIKTTLGGLSGQMKRLEIISENIANAEKSPDKSGKVYQRQMIVSQGSGQTRRTFNTELGNRLKATDPKHIQPGRSSSRSRPDDPTNFKVVKEKGAKLVYNPGHPMADENGYVKMPKVNIVEEMVDLISASRTYEANVTVINAAKQIAKKSLEI